jgi:large subunit ribosomal protein L13
MNIDSDEGNPYHCPSFFTCLDGFLMTTYTAKPADIKQDWYLIDATGKTLGRLASEVARRLRGKHKPEYTPSMDTGDYIVVINARNVRVSGNKFMNKTYYNYSGYPGGMKSETFDKRITRKPELVIESAVKGMLPKGPLGRQMYRKLKVYAGPEHKHEAQKPQPLEV